MGVTRCEKVGGRFPLVLVLVFVLEFFKIYEHENENEDEEDDCKPVLGRRFYDYF